jgi:hypothetical protein
MTTFHSSSSRTSDARDEDDAMDVGLATGKRILMFRFLGVVCVLTVFGMSHPLSAQEPEAADSTQQEYPEALEVDDNSVYPEYPDAAPDAPTARLRLVFDPISGETAKHVRPLEPFEFFIVAHDVQVALRGWEARVVLDPRLLLLEKEFGGLNVGQGTEIVTALKPNECKSGTPITLARFKAMLREDGLNDLVLGLAPVTKSSFDPPSPGYLVCRPESVLRAFDACDTCAVVNPMRVKPESDSTSPIDAILEPIRGR